MSQADLSNAALVIIGHGTTLHADSSAPVYQHAAELRKRKLFAEVHEAFWKQEPQVRTVLDNLTAPRIFVAPLFISEGYFSEQIIPRALGFGPQQEALGRVQRLGARTLFYCKPVGTHPGITDVVLARARDVVQHFPFPRAPALKDITLFIAGHGTGEDANSRAAIERQADLIRAANLYAAVHAVFLEESPPISACYQMAGTRNIVVVPFFISDGLHVREDIPVLLGEPKRLVQSRLASGQPTWRNPTEKQGKLVWYSPSVGTAPSLANLILERVHQAASLAGGIGGMSGWVD